MLACETRISGGKVRSILSDLRKWPRLAIAGALMLPACACSTLVGAQAPAPIIGRPSSASQGVLVRVMPGDTIEVMARRHGVPQKAILAANGLRDASKIRAGQTLRIPVEVQTLEPPQVARRAEPRPSVAEAALRPAPRLPAMQAPAPVAEPRPQPAPIPSPAPNRRDLDPDAERELLVSARMTALARPQLKPAGAVAVAAKDRPAGVGGPLIPAKPQQVAAVETKRPANEEKQELDPVPAAERPAVANNTFIWPVTGRIVSSFGERANGARNDGVNIAVPAGTPVKAADTGTVIYAGNELPGFGNLVLVKHSNGYVTAYAHNSKLLVRKGDKVSQGQAIAKAGRTGGVDVPQVHFEIRRGDKPVDPRRYIGNPDMNASL